MGTDATCTEAPGADPSPEALIEAAVEFVEGERGPVPISVAASHLSHLGEHSGGVWPLASPERWREAFRAADVLGLLVVDGELVKVRPAIVPEERSTVSQGSLF